MDILAFQSDLLLTGIKISRRDTIALTRLVEKYILIDRRDQAEKADTRTPLERLIDTAKNTPAVMDALNQDKWIQAIKELRSVSGADLKIAKDAIDRIRGI